MESLPKAEYWLRGPVEGIPPLVQPVAHALLQAREEVNKGMEGFPADRMGERPLGLASPAFHLQHLTGVLDRLFTYARGEGLSAEQLVYLGAEGRVFPGGDALSEKLERFNRQIDKSLQELSQVDESTLTAQRFVGRNRLPSTVIGLLFHAAEHVMRHTGQLLVTVRFLQADP